MLLNMSRFQYVIFVIALFALTALLVFPPRRYNLTVAQSTSAPQIGRSAPRAFLFDGVYGNAVVEGAFPADFDIDYPRLALESLALASTTAFLSLLCRPRRYAG